MEVVKKFLYHTEIIKIKNNVNSFISEIIYIKLYNVHRTCSNVTYGAYF